MADSKYNSLDTFSDIPIEMEPVQLMNKHNSQWNPQPKSI